MTKGDGGDDADGSLETGGDDTQPLDARAARPSPSQAKGLGLFRSKAPRVMHDLIRDLGLTTVQAAAILGNIGHECAGFTLLQEQKPLRGGHGGWGWCQWTGSRRTEFEKWAADHGLDFSGDRANYGFLLEELKGSQANAVRRLKEALSVTAPLPIS